MFRRYVNILSILKVIKQFSNKIFSKVMQKFIFVIIYMNIIYFDIFYFFKESINIGYSYIIVVLNLYTYICMYIFFLYLFFYK